MARVPFPIRERNWLGGPIDIKDPKWAHQNLRIYGDAISKVASAFSTDDPFTALGYAEDQFTRSIEKWSARKSSLEHFGDIGYALLNRQRLKVSYYAKGTDQTTEREVSPQRLIYYRDNWYRDAWCHLRNDLRSFALDGVRTAETLTKRADEISDKELHETLAESYGIFSGRATKRARLRFTAKRARWVAGETWHGQQASWFEKDGSYVLEVPYDKDPELVMEILKHGSEVEVISPAELALKIKSELKLALAQYS